MNEAEQDVLRADVVVTEHPGLVLRQDDNPPCPVSEPLEHGAPYGSRGRGASSPRSQCATHLRSPPISAPHRSRRPPPAACRSSAPQRCTAAPIHLSHTGPSCWHPSVISGGAEG